MLPACSGAAFSAAASRRLFFFCKCTKYPIRTASRVSRCRPDARARAHAAEDALDHAKRSANQRPPHLLPRRAAPASHQPASARPDAWRALHAHAMPSPHELELRTHAAQSHAQSLQRCSCICLPLCRCKAEESHSLRFVLRNTFTRAVAHFQHGALAPLSRGCNTNAAPPPASPLPSAAHEALRRATSPRGWPRRRWIYFRKQTKCKKKVRAAARRYSTGLRGA